MYGEWEYVKSLGLGGVSRKFGWRAGVVPARPGGECWGSSRLEGKRLQPLMIEALEARPT